MDMEESIAALKRLAAKPTLSSIDHTEVRKLMRYLKGCGMSNADISRLADGKWSESTVKGNTAGVRAAQPNQWHDAVNVINDLMSKDLTLGNVADTLDLRDRLREHDTTPEQVAELLSEADSAGVRVAAIVGTHLQLAQHSLSLQDVITTLSMKKALEDQGLTLGFLPSLVKSAQNFGSPQAIIEAVAEYVSLAELEQKKAAATERLSKVNHQVAAVQDQAKNLGGELARLQEPLAAYSEATRLGYSPNSLADLAEVTRKCGGPSKVFEAVKAFAGVSDILGQRSKAQTELATIKASTEELRAKHSHLNAAIAMCLSLIDEFNYGLDAMATILSVAEKYGQPLQVLRALDSYGKLKAVDAKLQEAEGRLAEREKLLAETEGRCQEALAQIEALNATALRVGSQVGQIEGRLESSRDLQQLVGFVQAPSKAGYEDNLALALFLVAALRSWVSANIVRFPYLILAQSNLDSLLKGLGGK